MIITAYTSETAKVENILSDAYGYGEVYIKGEGFYYKIKATMNYDDFCASLERVDLETMKKNRNEFGNVVSFEYCIFRLIKAMQYKNA